MENATTILSSSNFNSHNNQQNVYVPMEPWGYTASAIVLSVIGVCGFSLNMFAIILMYRDRQLWNPMNLILFNLVCSDFSVSILGNPFTLTAAIYHKWIFGSALCTLYGFFMALLGITSITTLTVMSYERFCLVKFPFSSKQLNNHGALISIACIWIYSISVTSPPLFGWGEYVNEAANISCSVNWESRSQNATSYIMFLFFFGLVVPLCVIVYSYVNIVLVMKKSAQRLGKNSRAENKVTCMVGIMILAFMFAWSPYAVFSLIKQFGDPASISPAMAVIPSLIAKSSICYNPIIYVGLNSQFRQAFNRFRGIESSVVTTTINTTINQISRTSDSSNQTKGKKFRQKLKKLNTTVPPDNPSSANCTVNTMATSKPRCDFEMKVLNGGKTVIIREPTSMEINQC